MDDYTIRAIADVPDAFEGRYPGAMRLLAKDLGARQVALTHRLMPPQSGGKGSYGHRHRTQEEIYLVVAGSVLFKLEDQIVEVRSGTAVRVGPGVTRSIWNDGPSDAEIVICSTAIEDPRADGELVEGFWPDDHAG